MFVREIDLETVDKVVKISQEEIGDVGVVVWDAALVLLKYLEKSANESKINLKDKTVVELGAGTGCVGLVACALGANVMLTDLPEVVPLIQTNIDNNKNILSGTVECFEWNWKAIDSCKHKFTNQIDMVLISDCIYYKDSLTDLVFAILHLCSDDTVIYLSYEERTSQDKQELVDEFFSLTKDAFHIVNIPHKEQHPEYQSQDIQLIKMTRKKI